MAIWNRNKSGEYNEHTTTINGKTVSIYSDRWGEEWHYNVNDGESFKLVATDRQAAMQEAEREVKSL